MTDPPTRDCLSVLHVNTQRGWRGGERQTLWLAESLVMLGFRSTIVALRGGELARRAAEAGVRVVAVPSSFELDPRAILAIRRAMGRFDVDIIHAHAAHAVGIAAVASIAAPDVQLVVTRRMDVPLGTNAASHWKYSRAAAIIAISRAVANVMTLGGVPHARITVIPSGVDLQRRAAPVEPATLAGFGVDFGSPLVVQVAQLAGDKDPLTFVRAMAGVHASLPDVRALLVGDGPLRDDVEHEICSLGLEGVVMLTGYRKDADRILAAADLVTLSSHREGLGSVLLDALAFGRPVVATAAGGIPEVVFDGETGFVVPSGDPPAMARAMARILCDSELAGRMSRAAIVRSSEFDLRSIAQRTAAVYSSVSA